MDSEILPLLIAEGSDNWIIQLPKTLIWMKSPFVAKKYGYMIITWKGYLKRMKKTLYRVWSVCSLLVKTLWYLTVCLMMQVLATRSVWSTSIWACITTPSSAGLSTTCSHLSIQSCRGWAATTHGTHVTAHPSSSPVLTLPPVLPKSSSSEYPELYLNSLWIYHGLSRQH